jgi:hypothetical protein
MVDFVVEEYERYERFHHDRFTQSRKIIDDWNSKEPPRDFNWQNSVHVPITFASEQTITPRIFAALFPNEAPVDVQVFGTTPRDQANRIKFLIQHHFRISDVQGEVLPGLTQNTLLGTGYVEAPQLFKKGWIVGQDGVRREVVLDNRPDCKSVSYFELYPHPAKLSMDDGLPLVRRRYMDAEYLKSLSDDPNVHFQNLQQALDSEPVNPRHMVETGIVDHNNKPFDIKKREEYEILEYWGGWDVSYEKDKKVVKKKAVPYWIIVVNRKVLVRGIPNPYNHQQPPYCKFTLFPDSTPNWYGVGIGKVGKPTQERLNKIVNQRLDNVDLVLNKQGFYNGNDPLINTKRLQTSQPGKWHKVSDTVNSIRWMDTPDVTASSYKEEELAKSDYREATGATVPLMPTDEGQHRTAAGINLLQGAAGIRFRPVLRKMETDLIQQLAHIYLSNLQQFMILPEWIRTLSNDGQDEPALVSPKEIQMKVKFIPTGVSETINKEVQIGQLLRYKEITVNDRTVNQAELNRRIGELMGFKELSKLVVNQKPVRQGEGELDPETQQLIQQRLAEGASREQIKLELLGNGPGGGAPPSRQPDRGQTPEAGQPVQLPGGVPGQ